MGASKPIPSNETAPDTSTISNFDPKTLSESSNIHIQNSEKMKNARQSESLRFYIQPRSYEISLFIVSHASIFLLLPSMCGYLTSERNKERWRSINQLDETRKMFWNGVEIQPFDNTDDPDWISILHKSLFVQSKKNSSSNFFSIISTIIKLRMKI